MVANLKQQIREAAAIVEQLRSKLYAIDGTLEKSPYGRCPICGALGVTRERQPNGNDTCENGHVYPSAKAVEA